MVLSVSGVDFFVMPVLWCFGFVSLCFCRAGVVRCSVFCLYSVAWLVGWSVGCVFVWCVSVLFVFFSVCVFGSFLVTVFFGLLFLCFWLFLYLLLCSSLVLGSVVWFVLVGEVLGLACFLSVFCYIFSLLLFVCVVAGLCLLVFLLLRQHEGVGSWVVSHWSFFFLLVHFFSLSRECGFMSVLGLWSFMMARFVCCLFEFSFFVFCVGLFYSSASACGCVALSVGFGVLLFVFLVILALFFMEFEFCLSVLIFS